MPYLNKAVVMGHAGKDAVTKETKLGPVLSFSLATSEGKDDNKKTIWHNIIVMGKPVEWLAISKGDLVYVEGKITKREYEGKEYSGITATTVLNLTGNKKPKDRFERESDIPE